MVSFRFGILTVTKKWTYNAKLAPIAKAGNLVVAVDAALLVDEGMLALVFSHHRGLASRDGRR